MRVHKEHRIECTPERYFELMFDPEFEKRMNMEALHTERCDVLEHSTAGNQWRMTVRVTPKDNMPGFIKKLVGGGFSYEEQRSHDKGSDRAVGNSVPSVMKEKLHMSYELRCVPDGDNACKRIMDWNVEVKIFGVGGQIEKFAAGEVERGMDNSARFFNEELKKVAQK